LIALTIKKTKMTQETWMQRCLELGAKGLGRTAPNPLVGSVIVYKDQIIGEGFHESWGEPHAEVNAIRSVNQIDLLKDATLFVNLEPCNHYGKTPPCADLIIQKGIRKVVVGAVDPNPQVNGGGIEKLKNAGVEVISGVLEKECLHLNRRFYTFHTKKKPYIILKWAQTSDGFMAPGNQEKGFSLKITNQKTNELVHLWRAQEQAILVGKNTILMDDPQLSVRLIEGLQPIPLILASEHQIPSHYKILNSDPKFIEHGPQQFENLFSFCMEKKIQSLLVEGGPTILDQFLRMKIWDEIRILTNTAMTIGSGLKAPEINLTSNETFMIEDNLVEIFYKTTA
jgi:diaminohydroxyphosphoribosylaminopyrimidine deaminase/5-amino-6-(5-phosphoribosylamino)uracil reductase